MRGLRRSLHHITAMNRELSRDCIRAIEERVQRDEGGRGIGQFMLTGELYNSAIALLNCKRVGIITGFPCLLDFTPPTETDGPLGAVVIAKALIAMGKEVVLMTDECNEEPILACVAGAGLSNELLTMESFPPRTNFDESDVLRLEEIHRLKCVVCEQSHVLIMNVAALLTQ
jgi:hypothetical protein